MADFMTNPVNVFCLLNTSSRALQRFNFWIKASCSWLYLRLSFSKFSCIRSRSSSNWNAFNLASTLRVDFDLSSPLWRSNCSRSRAFSLLSRSFLAFAMVNKGKHCHIPRLELPPCSTYLLPIPPAGNTFGILFQSLFRLSFFLDYHKVNNRYKQYRSFRE